MNKKHFHNHHIIPKHAGGSDDPKNLASLTVQEHAEAHRLLYEKHGRREDYLAWKGLEKQIGKEEIFIETSSIGGLNNKGKLKSESHKMNISEANKGQQSHWEKGDTNKKKKNLSKSMLNNTNSKNHSSPEYKKHQSEIMKKAWAKRKQKANEFLPNTNK